MNQECQLWMGNISEWMSEEFILDAFRKMGEDPLSVKMMKDKYTGQQAAYCFVSFQTDEAAMCAMPKLNGKPIPGTDPIVTFRLNSAVRSKKYRTFDSGPSRDYF